LRYENPRSIYEVCLRGHQVRVWSVGSVCKIMGPLFFEETGSDIVIQGIERRIENV
jgi:hypothetical protein